MTAMHTAFSSSACGTPRSGEDRRSWYTAFASASFWPSLSAATAWESEQAVTTAAAIPITAASFFMVTSRSAGFRSGPRRVRAPPRAL